jgi:hypothetical protein
MLKPVLVTLATATLASTSLPLPSTSQTLQLLTVTGDVAPIACASPEELYDLLNAADRRDLREAARVAGSHCEPLDGARYEVDRANESDGVVALRIFPANGDRKRSHIAYTLDEMVDRP